MDTITAVESEKAELRTIEEHIRSVLTLGFLLQEKKEKDASPHRPDTRQGQEIHNTVNMLERLAHCLVREPLEIVSVGLAANGPIAASSLAEIHSPEDHESHKIAMNK